MAGTYVTDDGVWDDSGNPASTWSSSSLSVQSGDIIVAVVNVTSTADQTPTLADTQTNTYTQIGTGDRDAGEEYGIRAYWARAGSTGSVTVTATYPSTNGTGSRIYTHVVRGCLASGDPTAGSAFDAKFFASTSTDAVTSGAITPTHDNCYLIGCFLPASNPSTSTGTGWTARFAANRIYGESQTQTTAASVAGTFTIATTSVGAACIVALREAAGGGGGGTVPRLMLLGVG